MSCLRLTGAEKAQHPVATLKLTLPNKALAAARRALARRHKVSATMKLSQRDQAGNTATQTWNVKLTR